MSFKAGTRVKVSNPSSAQAEYMGREGEVKSEAANTTPQCRLWRVLLDGRDMVNIFKTSELEAIRKPIGRPPKRPETAEPVKEAAQHACLVEFSPGQAVAVKHEEGEPAEGGILIDGNVSQGGKVRVCFSNPRRVIWVPLASIKAIFTPEPQVLEPVPAEPPLIEPEGEAQPEPPVLEVPDYLHPDRGAFIQSCLGVPPQEPAPPVPDAVRPDHYQAGGLEVFDVVEAFGLDSDAYLFNVVKYVLRHRNKGGLEDLKKARTYLDRRIANWEEATDGV